MTTRLTQIPAPFVKMEAVSRDNSDTVILGGLHLVDGPDVAALYKVARDLTVTPIPLPETAARPDSIALKVLSDGTLRVIISLTTLKADGTSDSGSTSQPVVHDIPGIFGPESGDLGLRALLRRLAKVITDTLG